MAVPRAACQQEPPPQPNHCSSVPPMKKISGTTTDENILPVPFMLHMSLLYQVQQMYPCTPHSSVRYGMKEPATEFTGVVASLFSTFSTAWMKKNKNKKKTLQKCVCCVRGQGGRKYHRIYSPLLLTMVNTVIWLLTIQYCYYKNSPGLMKWNGTE